MNADDQSSHHSPDLWISSGTIVILCRTELSTRLTSGGVSGSHSHGLAIVSGPSSLSLLNIFIKGHGDPGTEVAETRGS